VKPIRLSSGRMPRPSARRRVGSTGRSAGWRLLVCAALAGANLMALELIWLRFLSLFVQNSSQSIALIVAVVLAALAAGGLIASRTLTDARRVAYVPALAVLAAALTLGTYGAFQWTAGVLVADSARIALLAALLSGPTALLSGALFALLGEALAASTRSDRAAARLVAANTAGATIGPLAAAFLLLPRVGIEGSLVAVAVGYMTLGLLAAPDTAGRPGAQGTRRLLPVAAAVAVVAFFAFPYGLMARTYVTRVIGSYLANGETLVNVREGSAETIALLKGMWLGQPSYYRIVTNGFPMTATELPARRYMSYFAYWPLVLHTSPIRRALVVCYGLGVTAGAVTRIDSLESIDVVDTSRDIVAMSDLVYEHQAHPLRDPRVRVHFDDGRYFLQTTSESFDLITGEPPPPRTAGTVNLYTREYFRTIHDRLADGGVATYWLPVSRPWFEEVRVEAIIRAFCDVFTDCSLWNATPVDWMLVGRRNARGRVSEAQFSAPWASVRTAAALRDVGFEIPEQIGATFLGDAPYLRTLTSDTEPLTDNFPRRILPESPSTGLEDQWRDRMVFYRTVADTVGARDRFQRSEFVRELWPAGLLERTLPMFELQRIVNDVLWTGPNLLQQLDELHHVLTETSLRSVPLWILGMGNHPPTSDSLAAVHDDGTGMLDYLRGVNALVDREYPAAAAALGQAAARGVGDSRPLFVLAVCLAGRCDLADSITPSSGPGASAAEIKFWNWIDSRFRK
jgi:spermidine synthase